MNNVAVNKYESLSVADLLEAREAFHIHLLRKQNVVATAVGRFRRRSAKAPKTGPKRLDNTVVTDTSWPCILVFVKHWLSKEEFKKHSFFDDFIPSSVYLPDGREVPLCVIEAPVSKNTQEAINEQDIIFPSDFVGGGYPLVVESQGVERLASIGCVVSDGNKYYALTNRHVSGTPGTLIYTKVKGTLVPIGNSAGKAIGNTPFKKLYSGWEASNLVTNVDVGLVEIDDIRYWKTDIFSIGSIGDVVDLNTSNFSLGLISAPVKAFGCASGLLNGEIAALFYRYKSVGGIEYVADFLIGAPQSDKGLPTKNGDSGTVWVMETLDEENNTVNRPIAIQWGQHCFSEKGATVKQNYALATCLSNVLRDLEVDLVTGWNDSLGYTWGEVGHYTIANFAVQLVADSKLKTLMQNNLELITFRQTDLVTDNAIKRKRKTLNYTPLADVPDLVWKIRGGDHQRSLENPNHFADMDKPDSNGKTLLQLCKGKGASMKFLTPEEWLTYYSDKAVKDSSKGILPFRVWQIFLHMVASVSKGAVAEFVAAAGILAHYIGDACQPLHISYMYNGIPASGQGEGKKGEGVHEAFETGLVNKHNREIMDTVSKLIAKPAVKKLVVLKSGKEAAAFTVDLMKDTFKTIAPLTIVNAYIKDGDAFADKFWQGKGKTAVPGLFADGSRALASLWNSAWTLGGGANTIKNLSALDPQEIINLYEDETFLPSVNIHGIAQYLDL